MRVRPAEITAAYNGFHHKDSYKKQQTESITNRDSCQQKKNPRNF